MSEYIVVHGIRIAKDFVPETFGRLTTIGPRFLLPSDGTRHHQVCQCECGNMHVAELGVLRKGNTKSCGCHRRDRIKQLNIKNAKHGMHKTPEHKAWRDLKGRCYNPKHKSYPNYGGRGITVCDRWLCPVNGFVNFLADMGHKTTPKHEIERKDVNGNYCPENCCWATRLEQARNKRNSRMLTYNGKTQCLSAWAEEYGIKNGVVTGRLKAGWSVEKALTTKVRKCDRKHLKGLG